MEKLNQINKCHIRDCKDTNLVYFYVFPNGYGQAGCKNHRWKFYEKWELMPEEAMALVVLTQ